MTAAPLVRDGRCIACKGAGTTHLVLCRRCHGDGCYDCDGQGVLRVEAAVVCRHCRGSGRAGPTGWGLP